MILDLRSRERSTNQHPNDGVMVRIIGVVRKLLDEFEEVLHEIVIH